MPLAATALDIVENRILVLAVHAVDGVHLAKQRGADFQGGEMQGHEDHPLPFALRLLQVLHPLDMRQPRQPRLRPPPAHRHLEEGDAAGGEVLLEQAGTLGRRHLREAQLQVARGNRPAAADDAVHQGTQHASEPEQHGVRQLHDQPEHAQPQPQRPEARMKEGGTKAGTVHERFRRRTKPGILPCRPPFAAEIVRWPRARLATARSLRYKSRLFNKLARP
ncbi:hypothetical protein D3C78_644570 [compost metagenome]